MAWGPIAVAKTPAEVNIEDTKIARLMRLLQDSNSGPTGEIAIHAKPDILLSPAAGKAWALPSRWHDYRRGASMAKSKKGLDHRHRDKSGRIDRKHGNTKVAALRKEYGPGFAKGRRKDMMLKNLLKETGAASLHEYLKHHHK